MALPIEIILEFLSDNSISLQVAESGHLMTLHTATQFRALLSDLNFREEFVVVRRSSAGIYAIEWDCRFDMRGYSFTMPLKEWPEEFTARDTKETPDAPQDYES